MRVLIVGGGIGGLVTAIALHKAGLEAHVYERAAEFREAGAGIALARNAMRALDVIGLGDAVRSEGIGGAQGGARTPDGTILVRISADMLRENFGDIVVMHRAELLDLLLRHVEPERIHPGRTFTGFEQRAGRVTAYFSSGEAADGDVLIGADGIRSAVGTHLFGERPIRYAGYTAWRSVVEFPRREKLMISETWGRGCRFGIVPMNRDRVYWFATNNAPEGEHAPEGETKNALLRLFRGWHEPVEALIAAAGEDSILRNDIYDMDPLPKFAAGRVALLGDAAHAMTPNLGQGACQAIEDAVTLAVCLKAAGEKVESGLREYERRRVARTSDVVLQSRRLGAIAQVQNPVLCRLRDLGLRATPERIASRQMKSLLDYEVLKPGESL